MGLDTVEMLMDIEDEFSIKIPEERLATLRTAGDVARAVIELRRPAPDPAREKDFLAFRRALSAETGMDEEAIAPETRLADLFPWHGRARRWRRVHDLLTREGVELPPLQSHRSYLAGTVMFGIVCALCILLTTKHPGPAVWVAGLAGLLLVVGALRHTYSPGFPKAETVAGLFNLWPDDRAVERRVFEMIARAARVPPERVTPQTRLVDDLRLDA